MAEHQDLHLLPDDHFIKPTMIGVLCWMSVFFFNVCVRACSRACVSGFIKTRWLGGDKQVQCVSWILKATFLYILSAVHFAQFINPQATEEEELVGHILEPDSPPEAPDALRHAFTGGARAECHDYCQTSQFVTEAVVSAESLSRIDKVSRHVLLNPWQRDSVWIQRTHQLDIQQKSCASGFLRPCSRLWTAEWITINTPISILGASW